MGELCAGLRAELGDNPFVQRAAFMAVATPVKAARRLNRLRALLADALAAEAVGGGDRSDWQAEADALEAALAGSDRCRDCGRELENEESKARGIGPDCAAKRAEAST